MLITAVCGSIYLWYRYSHRAVQAVYSNEMKETNHKTKGIDCIILGNRNDQNVHENEKRKAKLGSAPCDRDPKYKIQNMREALTTGAQVLSD